MAAAEADKSASWMWYVMAIDVAKSAFDPALAALAARCGVGGTIDADPVIGKVMLSPRRRGPSPQIGRRRHSRIRVSSQRPTTLPMHSMNSWPLRSAKVMAAKSGRCARATWYSATISAMWMYRITT